jgi:hypothetical protein
MMQRLVYYLIDNRNWTLSDALNYEEAGSKVFKPDAENEKTKAPAGNPQERNAEYLFNSGHTFEQAFHEIVKRNVPEMVFRINRPNDCDYIIIIRRNSQQQSLAIRA